jgi:hypothetical protein
MHNRSGCSCCTAVCAACWQSRKQHKVVMSEPFAVRVCSCEIQHCQVLCGFERAEHALLLLLLQGNAYYCLLLRLQSLELVICCRCVNTIYTTGCWPAAARRAAALL